MGLNINMFAMMMLAIIASLLFIIFSFSFYGILAVMIINTLLYVVLTHLVNHPQLLHLKKIFPKCISNKKSSFINDEKN